jgi:aspartate ammonia-lyase
MRIETDSLGSLEIPAQALYGIHSLRAKLNFPGNHPFHEEWYRAMGLVKTACYQTYRQFCSEALTKYEQSQLPIQLMDDELTDALLYASQAVAQGHWFDHFIVPAIQGGAGTSINMNINEIIANAAIVHLGHQPGQYRFCDPIEQANIFQSTNDVVPTALRVAAMQLFMTLDESINNLRGAVEQLENANRNVLRMGYTQMQEAVPTSYDKLLSTYSNALSRDWWRVSKCLERIKEVNLGGGAIGTGLSIPRYFIVNATSQLQKLTGLPVTRSENLSDATSNLDALVEVHATIKAHAVNLEKMASDIRLLGADLFKNRQVQLPKKQVGSSIMPGKVNPVIPEFVIGSVHKVYANDLLISNLCGQGCLELNAYLPIIGNALLESIKLLINANQSLLEGLFDGLKIDVSQQVISPVFYNPSVTTALSPYIGYHNAAQLAVFMKNKRCTIFDANSELKLMDNGVMKELLSPQNLLKLGYTLTEVTRLKQ